MIVTSQLSAAGGCLGPARAPGAARLGREAQPHPGARSTGTGLAADTHGSGGGCLRCEVKDKNQTPTSALYDPFTLSSNTGKSALLSQNLKPWLGWEGWTGVVSVGVPQMPLYKLMELTLQASVRYSRLCPQGPSSRPPKASEPGGTTTHRQSLRSGPHQREHIPTHPGKDSVPPRGTGVPR